MLIEYDLSGNGTVLKTFSKPAKDSDIKGVYKKKKSKAKKGFEFSSSEKSKEDTDSLFE